MQNSNSDPNQRYDFINLVKEYNQLDKETKSSVTPTEYFNRIKDQFNNDEALQQEKKKAVKIFCETMYGINNLDVGQDFIKQIKGMNSEGEIGKLKKRNQNMEKFVNDNSDALDDSKQMLTKFLFTSHYLNLLRMPDEIYKKLKSGNSNEVQEANLILKNFILLYEKHPKKLPINQIINNNKIIDAVNELIFAFNLNPQFDPRKEIETKQVQQIIDKSIDAAAFLMNYDYLFNLSNEESEKDPIDEFRIFLLSWKEKINNTIRSANIQQDQDGDLLFTSEFDVYLRTRFILNQINPKNTNFAEKIIPSILSQNKDAYLENRFSIIEKEIISSFYDVENNSFSGSFFNNLPIDFEQLIPLKDDNFEKMSLLSVAFIVKMERYINQSISNQKVDDSIQKDISTHTELLSEKVFKSEFKSLIINDVSNILICHFNQSRINPARMLDIFMNLLFIVFRPYYVYNSSQGNDSSTASVIIYMCKVSNILPYICSAWSNYLLNEIKKKRSFTFEGEFQSIIQNNENYRYDYYKNFKEANCIENLYQNIIESLLGIVIQESLGIKESISIGASSTSDTNTLQRFKGFIQQILNKDLDPRIKKLAEYAKNLTD